MLFGQSIPARDLTKVNVILRPGLSRALFFEKQARVEIVRQSIALLFESEAKYVQLFQDDRLLENEQLIADLSAAQPGWTGFCQLWKSH